MRWAFAFWNTVVLNCIQPVNIEACLPAQDWLFPAVHDYIRFKTEEPYASEKRTLRSVRMDDR